MPHGWELSTVRAKRALADSLDFSDLPPTIHTYQPLLKQYRRKPISPNPGCRVEDQAVARTGLAFTWQGPSRENAGT